MAKVIAEKGCSISEEILYSKIQEEVKSYNQSFAKSGFLIDQEGYEIGGLASLILRLKFSNDKEWYSEMTKGKHPTTLLFKKTKPIKEEIPNDIWEAYQKEADKINSDLDTSIGKNLEEINNKKFLRIAFPGAWAQSNFMPSGFYISDKIKNVTIAPLMFEHKFINGESDLVIGPKKVLFLPFSAVDYPCGLQKDFFILVKKNDIESEGNKISISSEGIKGSLKGSVETDSAGNEYFCVE